MKASRMMCLFTLFVAATAIWVTGAPLRASSTDDRIEAAARASYNFKTYLKEDDIQIRSKDGVVTLTGTVASDSHRFMAQETVADLPGVQRVDNKLLLKDEESSKPTSDLWIWDKVKATLLFHRSVSAIHTDVAVKEGVVTLKGVASNDTERALATEYARDVEGVKSVDNQMTLSPNTAAASRTLGEKMDDASISAGVRAGLLYHRSTRSIPTHVKTVLGVVTVSGTAQNRAEKQLVTKIAEDINGVVKVENEMTIGNAK